MPELPEVETIKRDLEKLIVGLRIESVEIFDGRVISLKNKAAFAKKLQLKTIRSVLRRAKAIIIELDSGEKLVVHLKMTGQLIYGEHLKKKNNLKDTKVVFKLSNGKYLNYNDQRLFGRLWIVKDLGEISFFEKLGPEPFSQNFSAEWLKVALNKKSTPIKVLLMNQEFVAGIGNIYASEILFDAKINPRRSAGRLKSQEVNSLYFSTIKILQEAIDCRGSSLRNYRDSSGQKGDFVNRIQVYAKDSQGCPGCKSLIQRIVQAGRSTFFCPKCQN